MYKPADQMYPGGYVCELVFWNNPQLPENQGGGGWGGGKCVVFLKRSIPSASAL